MEYRVLGRSGLKVPVLTFGTGTFGGVGRMFHAWGTTDATAGRRLIDICLEAGVDFFDTADNYSESLAEQVLGEAIAHRRQDVRIATKTALPFADDQVGGSSGSRLHRAVDASLKRLKVERIELLQLHARDAHTPDEETLGALDELIRAGKVGHIGVSNFAGWELMRALGTADRLDLPRYCAHQVYYSLIGRDYEWELMPLGLAEGVSAMVWSPLGWGRLTGKLKRGAPLPAGSRLNDTEIDAPPVDRDLLYRVLDVVGELAEETGRSVPQLALNWLLQRPSVATVVIGARNEEQLRDNLGAVGWSLTAEQVARLDAASSTTPPYPYYLYWRGGGFGRLNPPPVAMPSAPKTLVTA
jgi:aryl-alcohol dehydrogenase-like predicted oxidoreductase